MGGGRIPEHIQAARLRLVRTHPYLAAAVWSMVPVESPGLGTMATDRWGRLYYDPEAVDRWTPEERAAVLYHEVCHLLRSHASRFEGADHQTANAATDAEINDDLTTEDVPLPSGAVTPSSLSLPPNLTAEEYYDMLRNRPQPPTPTPNGGGGDGTGETPSPAAGNCGSAADGRQRRWEAGPPSSKGADGTETPEGMGPAELDVVRRKVASEVRAAKGRGTVPASLARWAEDVLTPKVDWRRQLRAAVRATIAYAAGREDYTYGRPNRRQSAYPAVLPSLRAYRPRVSVVVDTSGSMGEAELAQAVAEVGGVLRTIGTPVEVLSVDAAVKGRSRVTDARQVRLSGGGGTDMRVGIEAALQATPRPDVVVVLTDGETPWPERPPDRVRVVAGILWSGDDAPSTPEWVRAVRIEVDA